MTFLAQLCFTGHMRARLFIDMIKKSSHNNAKDLTNPERGRKLNVKAASFLSNSPHCVWILQGARAREEPYAQDTALSPWAAQGEGGQEAVQHNPYSIFILFVSVVIFACFLAE